MSWLLTWFRSRFETSAFGDDEITIEQYLLRKDQYRITTAVDPLPLPVTKRSIESSIHLSAFEKLLPKIQTIVHSHYSIEQYRINLCEVTKPDYSKGDEKRTTLIIDIDQSFGPPTQWSIIINSLKSLFKSTDLSSIDIELVDESRGFIPRIFPETVGSDSIIWYENARLDLVALLLEKMPDCCHGMSLFKLGNDMKTAMPFIVIFMKPLAIHNWKALKKEIISVLNSKNDGSSMDMGVEFVPGRISSLIGEDFRPSEEISNFYPTMGSSICPRGSDVTGSLGGFLKLNIGNQVHKGFLTCHHVIAHDIADYHVRRVAQTGYKYFSESAPRPIIQCPSSEDLEWTKNKLREDITDYSEEVKKTEVRIAERTTVGADVNAGLVSSIQRDMKHVENSQQELYKCNNFPKELGQVLVSSGHAVNSTTRSILDWAFVELSDRASRLFDQNFETVNRLPSGQAPELRAHGNKLKYSGESSGEKSLVAQGFGVLEKGNWYFKRGRSTGITVGMCNGTELVLFKNEDRERYTVNGTMHNVHSNPTYEYVLMSFPKTRENIDAIHTPQEPFAESGDSGSFVIDRAGNICGLLYGSLGFHHEERNGGSGLVTSINDVIASIREKTAIITKDGDKVLAEVTLEV